MLRSTLSTRECAPKMQMHQTVTNGLMLQLFARLQLQQIVRCKLCGACVFVSALTAFHPLHKYAYEPQTFTCLCSYKFRAALSARFTKIFIAGRVEWLVGN